MVSTVCSLIINELDFCALHTHRPLQQRGYAFQPHDNDESHQQPSELVHSNPHLIQLLGRVKENIHHTSC